jgi:hypothetical protein
MSIIDELNAGVVYKPARHCGDTHADDGGPIDVAATEAIMRRAADVIAKLPRYADTGEPFIPMLNEAFVESKSGNVLDVQYDVRCNEGEWESRYLGRSKFFSTSEAAEEAKEKRT